MRIQLAFMYLGKVTGTVVATQKVPGLRGSRLLLVQPLDQDGNEVGDQQVAVDTVRAGPGDLVVLVGSREAALALETSFVPVDAAIVGLVDDLHVPSSTVPVPVPRAPQPEVVVAPKARPKKLPRRRKP